MFRDPAYRAKVLEEMFLFKAKVLAVMGQMNARGVETATSDQMMKVLGVLRGLMDAWESGDMFEIEIRRFDLGLFREDVLPAAPKELDGGDIEHRTTPPDQLL